MNIKLLLEHTRNLSILYVEDDTNLLNDTAELLAMYFKSIDTAVDGEDGLQKYIDYKKENNSFYDIVMTDLNMPKLNGIDMSSKILDLNVNQAIIITTAYNSPEYLIEAINLGIDAYILKPIVTEQLNKALFKSSQAVSDHKMIEIYMSQIEDLNTELESNNAELVRRNKELVKSFRMLDTVLNKEEIVQQTPQRDGSDVNKDIKNQVLQLIDEDLYELGEILTDIDVSIISIINKKIYISKESLDVLIKGFEKYASILKFYTFFNDLSVAMLAFSNTMRDSDIPESEETINNVFMFLETFIYVLSKWHQDIASGDESKLNQLDASIISDMNTITNMWTQNYDDEVNAEDMDDIFDF